MLLYPHSDTMSIPTGLPFDAPYHHRRWRLIEHLVSVFFARFRAQYLQKLQERHKWHHSQREVQLDDVVLLTTDKARLDWPRAVVVEVHPSSDGVIRTATVRTSNGTLFQRDVRKLVLLEPAGGWPGDVGSTDPPDESPTT